MARRYLVEPARVVRPYRYKREALTLASRAVRHALLGRLGSNGARLLKLGYKLQGEHGPQTFDLSVANGVPYFAAKAISFEGPSSRDTEKEVSAAAWAIEDVRRTPDGATLPLAVVTLPPREADDGTYQRATEAFRGFGARIVTEGQIGNWAEEMTQQVPPQAAGPR